jgi:hypothetical protein
MEQHNQSVERLGIFGDLLSLTHGQREALEDLYMVYRRAGSVPQDACRMAMLDTLEICITIRIEGEV